MEHNNRVIGFLLRILPETIASKSASRARAVLLSLPRRRGQFGRQPRRPPNAQFLGFPPSDDPAPRPTHEDNAVHHLRYTSSRNRRRRPKMPPVEPQTSPAGFGCQLERRSYETKITKFRWLSEDRGCNLNIPWDTEALAWREILF